MRAEPSPSDNKRCQILARFSYRHTVHCTLYTVRCTVCFVFRDPILYHQNIRVILVSDYGIVITTIIIVYDDYHKVDR